MRIVVVTSCTGKKAVEGPNSLKPQDFRKGQDRVRMREAELAELMLPAAELYTGQQHVRLMRGVQALAGSASGNGSPVRVDMWVLSAGYGLVSGSKNLAPYECTFSGMKVKELREWADMLNVPADIRKILAEPYDLALLLLGDSYLKACDLDDSVELGGATIAFCGNVSAETLPSVEGLHPVILSNAEARRFSCGLVGLKGEVAARALIMLRDGISPEELISRRQDFLGLLDTPAPQSAKTERRHRAARRTREKLRFTHHAPRRNAKMLYFIPEWDDRVDPDYDFSCDGITPERNPYEHDVYSHELYERPNYDGVLVSKSVIEDNQKKRGRIEAIGIHAHIRVPRSFPVMGDCGAFNYITEKDPPFETEETVRFYEALDFDYGVSVDHLIVPQVLERTVRYKVLPDGSQVELTAEEFSEEKKRGLRVAKRTPARGLFSEEPVLQERVVRELDEAKRRWRITLANARDFIETHRRLGCKFTPIAGCQGWDVESQTEMFRLQQEMGYDYIALGGLVRAKTAEILEILDAVSRIRRRGTRVHLFGVARPEALEAFADAGITSIDSARFLRQAWLSATSNYYSGHTGQYVDWLRSAGKDKDRLSTWRYTALRIPPTNREGSDTPTAKAKKLLESGHDLQTLREMERRTLAIVHAYDRGQAGLEETLEMVKDYDLLMGGDERNGPLYRRLLEDKPWKDCPCTICRHAGIDVVIFRRNNRNRRRGFHNTWWFHRVFCDITGSR